MLVERRLGDFVDVGLHLRYIRLPETIHFLIGGGNLFLRRCDSLRQLLILGDIRLDSLHAAEVCLHEGHQPLAIFNVGILEVLQGDVIGIYQLLLADGTREVLGLLNALIDPFAVGILAGAVVQQAGIVHHAPETSFLFSPITKLKAIVGDKRQHSVVLSIRQRCTFVVLDGNTGLYRGLEIAGIHVCAVLLGIHC